MPNPTTNKPATPVFGAGIGFGATAYACVPFCETAGLPVEAKTLTLGRYYDGAQGQGIGPAPAVQATGFPHTPAAGPSLKFGYGAPTLLFPGAGFPSAGLPVKRVYAAVFKLSYKHPQVSGNVAPFMLFGTGTYGGSTPGNGVCATLASNNTYNLGWFRSFGGTQFAVTNFALVVGQWYAVALSVDQTGSPYGRQLQVYDYTAQALLTTQSTTDTTAMSENAVSDLLVNPLLLTNTEYYPVAGEFACVLLDSGSTWTDGGAFLNFYTDPWATVRGTYSAAGTFAAGQFDVHHAENGVVALSGARATGTGVGGTGSPTYFIQRTTDLSAAPAAGNRIGSPTANTSGNVSYVDNTAVLGTTYGYRIEAVDGSSTVYYPATTLRPVLGRPRKGTNMGLVFCGDSRTQSYAEPLYAARLLYEFGDMKVAWMNRGKSGLFARDWSNGATSQWTLSVTGGTPTSGAFGISVAQDGGGQQNATGIQWNATAAQVKTALELLANVGSGNTTVTGGPLPGTPITVAFTTNHAYVLSLQTSSNTMNNSAAPTFTMVYAGNAPNTTFLTPSVAEAVAAGLNYALLEIGTNDMNAATPTAVVDYRRAVASGAAYIVANGIKVFLVAPPICRQSTMTPTQAEVGRQYAAQLATLADGVNVFYIGSRVVDYTADNFYGSADGLHGMTGEAQAEGHFWGKGMLDVLQPTGAGHRRANGFGPGGPG